MFLKFLSHFITKIKNFVKYFDEAVLKYFKISTKFLNISKVKCFIVHPYIARLIFHDHDHNADTRSAAPVQTRLQISFPQMKFAIQKVS